MDTFVFHEGTLAERILVKDANELWMRLIIISFFIIFSIYAQLIIRRLKKAESEVKKMGEDLDQYFSWCGYLSLAWRNRK
jgi:hypothetical protein